MLSPHKSTAATNLVQLCIGLAGALQWIILHHHHHILQYHSSFSSVVFSCRLLIMSPIGVVLYRANRAFESKSLNPDRLLIHQSLPFQPQRAYYSAAVVE